MMRAVDELITLMTKVCRPVSRRRLSVIERGDPLCSDIPEWIQEFRENLVDDRVPERRDSHASSSHEMSLEPTFKRSMDL